MRFCFILYCILISVTAPAQLEEGVLEGPIDLNKFTPAELKDYYVDILIDKALPEHFKLPFSSIEIIDCRQDTSKIGFIPANPTREGANSFESIVVKGGLKRSLGNILNEHYRSFFSDKGFRLFIVIKRFWVDPFPTGVMPKKGDVEKRSVFDTYISLEFFFEKDSLYYPVKRIDTLMETFRNDSVPGCDSRWIKNCRVYGNDFAKVFEGIDFNFYTSRINKAKNKMSKQGLDSFVNKYNNYAIVKDTFLKRGIYMSFDEFRNNNPSIKDYRTKLHKRGIREMLVLYNLENGKEERISKYWGYCDGENIFCKFTQYPMSKFGNTFEFFVDKEEYYSTFETGLGPYLKNKRKTLAQDNYFDKVLAIVIFFTSSIFYKVEPMQLDMETGRIY